jgi:HD-GYP domain-containing protein (c-di-GMP phosphodiesterase class II)/GGDEF domain-containing protein
MARSTRGRGESARPALATGILLAVAFALLAGAVAGVGPAALLLIVAAAVAAIAAVWVWWAERASSARARAGLEGLVEERDAAKRRLEAELRRREEALGQARELLGRLQRSRRAEREFNQELRSQLHRAHQRQAAEHDDHDVKDLILRTAIELVEGDRGLLLSRHDADGDGELDVLRAQGFESDPADSVVAQRFAREVLARDEIIREDEPKYPEAEPSDADREIDCMVAVPVYVHDRFQGVVICANRDGGFAELDDDLLLALGDHAGATLHSDRLHHEAGEARRAAVRMLADAVQARDPQLQRSARQVVAYARALAHRLELDPAEEESLVSAAMLRDVGNLAITDGLLFKPGALTPEERAVIELHPRIGFDIVGRLPALHEAALAVLYHHERYDGRGYPAGLKGEHIPRLARLLAVADAYVAMTQDRPYRPRLPPADALATVIEESGRQFDPEITQLFIEEVGRSGALTAPADAVADLFPLPPPHDGESLRGDGPSPVVDGLTMLEGHRSFREAVAVACAEACAEQAPAVVMAEIQGLERVNREEGYAAGDRVILAVAAGARRAAVAAGASVYRDGGRRLALLAPNADEAMVRRLEAELHAEFAAGPEVRVASAAWRPGDWGGHLADRALRALRVKPSATA